MSDSTVSTETLREGDGDPQEMTVHKDGYDVTFYGGFASQVAIKNGDGSHVLYKQTKPFKLPKGKKKPSTKHFVRLKGGKNKQDIRLDIQDPELRIARITIELYGEGHEVGFGNNDEAEEALIIDNDTICCPPRC